MRVLQLVLPSFLALHTLGCLGSSGAASSHPSASTGYSASVGSSLSSGMGAVSAVSPRASPGGFVVRPDTIEITFVLTGRGADPRAILADLKTRAQAITQRLGEAAGSPVTSKMRGVSTSADGSELAEPAVYVVRVDGSIDVALAAEQDYWARSGLWVSLVAATRDLVAATKSSDTKSSETGVDLGFSAPRPLLKDAQKLRPKLLELWTERARQLAKLAESDKAPLAIVDCAPPGDIDQRVVSLEEISLSVPVNCKLSSTAAALAP
ncbi:hypothetical protein [Sorangium sp. So ce362]|uniref:hypothetical protein n=1 Tax=Sorangium sp. So ce362 TaxID=3133303 RepID=UPI003F63D96B